MNSLFGLIFFGLVTLVQATPLNDYVISLHQLSITPQILSVMGPIKHILNDSAYPKSVKIVSLTAQIADTGVISCVIYREVGNYTKEPIVTYAAWGLDLAELTPSKEIFSVHNPEIWNKLCMENKVDETILANQYLDKLR